MDGTTTNTTGQRPLSKAESTNPREFQLNQLRRRFRPTETSNDAETTLEFGLAPSDPDFPFEMDKLQCVLHVPRSYPSGARGGRPTLNVVNADMDDAYRANVARGFDDIVDSSFRTGARGSLLSWMNALDRHLERLLTSIERGPTLKFVPNSGDAPPVVTTTRPAATNTAAATATATEKMKGLAVSADARPAPATTTRQVRFAKPAPPRRVYTPEEKAEAERRRATETRQIEARLGRLPFFQKAKDELSFVIPVQPAKVNLLPVTVRSVKTVKLVVPRLYPLEPSTVELQGVYGEEVRAVHLGFAQWVKDNAQLNLMSQINYLTSNMHNLAKTPLETEEEEPVPAPTPVEEPSTADVAESQGVPSEVPVAQDGDRPHVIVVPRPPEWTVGANGSDSSGTDDYSGSTEEFSDDDDDEEGGAPVPSLPEATKEQGVALSFPFLELYGIELLELVGLHITIKCDRCKESMDVRVPQVKDKGDTLTPKAETCKKCSNTMSFGFRRQFMHSHTNRAGYLDLDGCTVSDLLPSSFIPTCAECSTPFPDPGVVAVRGESAMANCRKCHRKMVFKVPEVKFLRVGSAAYSSRDRAPLRKKPKEVLGIVAGQELPRRGRCQHYGKSYRWFRFSCCAKVFPCDKCHDAETDHPNEHANRMICGFCSREQIYRPENCGICRAVLIGKAGSGFWEGGKGTRNRALMSRKDPRKFKRRPGSAVGSSSKKK